MSNNLLYRVNYRNSSGKTFLGLWIQDKKSMKLQRNAMILAHGENNVQVEVVYKDSGRPFIENEEDDE